MTEDDPDQCVQPQVQPKLRAKKSERAVPPAKVADQIFLQEVASARFDRWVQNINARFEGFGKISKNDIADFLFRKHSEDLSEEELTEIGNEMYDEVHWLSWALEKITQSKIGGETLTLGELIARKNEVTCPASRVVTKSLKRAKPRAALSEQSSDQLPSVVEETEVV